MTAILVLGLLTSLPQTPVQAMRTMTSCGFSRTGIGRSSNRASKGPQRTHDRFCALGDMFSLLCVDFLEDRLGEEFYRENTQHAVDTYNSMAGPTQRMGLLRGRQSSFVAIPKLTLGQRLSVIHLDGSMLLIYTADRQIMSKKQKRRKTKKKEKDIDIPLLHEIDWSWTRPVLLRQLQCGGPRPTTTLRQQKQ